MEFLYTLQEESSLPLALPLATTIALFITYFVGKKMLAKEIEVEEKALTEKTAEEK